LTIPGLLCGSPELAERWLALWRQGWPATQVMVLLAATDTAAVPGISAAGSTPAARRATAAADAELLLLGPEGTRPHALPPLPAGVSPALISHVVVRSLGLTPLVVDLGCALAPAVPHLRLPAPAGGGSARCLSSGAAMAPQRVAALLGQGRRWGRRLARRSPAAPLLIAECVPGGTTTAQGLLCALGVEAAGLVSGSLRHPAHGLKAALVEQGLRSAPRLGGEDPHGAVACLGDPMQPLAAGLLLEAALADVPVMLAGGSQMAAVFALALALAAPAQRSKLIQAVAIATTRWVAQEEGSDLVRLLQQLGRRWQVEPLAFRCSLAFQEPCHPALASYEQGYVKEGVGAGGLALLWELSGRDPRELARRCDLACERLMADSRQGTSEGLRSTDG
jgi:uncharacterized protein (TIGR00303 family)